MKKSNVKVYVISIAIALGVGALAAFLTRGSMDIYSEIKTPPLSPPGFLFPIVWTVLYTLMGISAAIVYTSENGTSTERNSALKIYAESLAVNFLWSIVFFNFRAFLTAFAVIVLLLYLILRTVSAYRKIETTAAYLQIPYALWVAFASYLNFAIWVLNR